jgi:hypothetical protein
MYKRAINGSRRCPGLVGGFVVGILLALHEQTAFCPGVFAWLLSIAHPVATGVS